MTANEFCTPFLETIKPKEDETIIFSFIIYKSREDRDRINKKVMEDPRLKDSCGECEKIFDVKRMNYGGFKAIVEYS